MGRRRLKYLMMAAGLRSKCFSINFKMASLGILLVSKVSPAVTAENDNFAGPEDIRGAGDTVHGALSGAVTVVEKIFRFGIIKFNYMISYTKLRHFSYSFNLHFLALKPRNSKVTILPASYFYSLRLNLSVLNLFFAYSFLDFTHDVSNSYRLHTIVAHSSINFRKFW